MRKFYWFFSHSEEYLYDYNKLQDDFTSIIYCLSSIFRSNYHRKLVQLDVYLWLSRRNVFRKALIKNSHCFMRKCKRFVENSNEYFTVVYLKWLNSWFGCGGKISLSLSETSVASLVLKAQLCFSFLPFSVFLSYIFLRQDSYSKVSVFESKKDPNSKTWKIMFNNLLWRFIFVGLVCKINWENYFMR